MFRGALYNRFYLFPKQAAAWKQIAESRQEVTLDDGWTEYPWRVPQPLGVVARL